MRIISKYKDYYDGLQALGMDKTLVYSRVQESKVYEKPVNYQSFIQEMNGLFELSNIVLDGNGLYRSKHRIGCRKVMVGFCGQIILGVKFVLYEDREAKSMEVFYDAQSVFNYCESLKQKYRSVEFYERYYKYYEGKEKRESPSLKTWERVFDSKLLEKDYTDWFHYFKAPVFYLPLVDDYTYTPFREEKPLVKKHEIEVIVNPKLKQIQFYKAKDAYTCYQDIAQFIGGVLTSNELNESKLSDIEKVKQHGFDERYGFRKRPNKGSKKRNKK